MQQSPHPRASHASTAPGDPFPVKHPRGQVERLPNSHATGRFRAVEGQANSSAIPAPTAPRPRFTCNIPQPGSRALQPLWEVRPAKHPARRAPASPQNHPCNGTFPCLGLASPTLSPCPVEGAQAPLHVQHCGNDGDPALQPLREVRSPPNNPRGRVCTSCPTGRSALPFGPGPGTLFRIPALTAPSASFHVQHSPHRGPARFNRLRRSVPNQTPGVVGTKQPPYNHAVGRFRA